MLQKKIKSLFRSKSAAKLCPEQTLRNSANSNRDTLKSGEPIGVIAGSGSLPLRFAKRARSAGHRVVAVCYEGETDQQIADEVDVLEWIKLGQLGRMIEVFLQHNVRQVVMLGGINRVKLFGGVKLDAKGALLLLRLRSSKDDVILRGVAEELDAAGVRVLSCATFFENELITPGVITRTKPSSEELRDIEVGSEALRAMSSQHIGQLVVVKDGVIVAVEAVEGSDKAIIRGGELGGAGVVVVKCAKTVQDLRFDIPTVGLKTIESLKSVNARVLALESGRCMLLDREAFIEAANQAGIAVIGIAPLVDCEPASL